MNRFDLLKSAAFAPVALLAAKCLPALTVVDPDADIPNAAGTFAPAVVDSITRFEAAAAGITEDGTFIQNANIGGREIESILTGDKYEIIEMLQARFSGLTPMLDRIEVTARTMAGDTNVIFQCATRSGVIPRGWDSLAHEGWLNLDWLASMGVRI
jgi:hypothetical protein